MNLASFIFAQLPPRLILRAPLAVGEGLEPSYQHSWGFPSSLTFLFLIAALIIVAFLYWRERGRSGMVYRSALIVLRMSLVSLVVWMLYGWMQQQHVTDLADIIVLIDDSHRSDGWRSSTSAMRFRLVKSAGNDGADGICFCEALT